MNDKEHNTWRLPSATYYVLHWAQIRLVTFDFFDPCDTVDSVDIKQLHTIMEILSKNHIGTVQALSTLQKRSANKASIT